MKLIQRKTNNCPICFGKGKFISCQMKDDLIHLYYICNKCDREYFKVYEHIATNVYIPKEETE